MRENMKALAAEGMSVSITGLTKRYGSTTALQSIDLEVHPGEFLTLLGPSGSGKTTTLHAIAGFVQPDSGSISVGQREMSNVPPHKRGVGVVFQNYALFSNMTVEQNLMFPLKQHKVPRSQRSYLVEQALRSVHLYDMRHRYPGQLSGGQQQRVAVSRAMVYQPGVLLMDEPLGALDMKLRDWLQMELRRIHQELGSTFVYVTHDQQEALTLSNRIAVFNHGRIEQIGTPAELYEKPSSLFVGKFVGESTVLRGKVSRDGSGTGSWLDGPNGRLYAEGRSLQEGTVGALIVRPEDVELRRMDEKDNCPADANQVNVSIEDRVYLGSAVRFKVQMPDGTEGVVRAPQRDAPELGPDTTAIMRWPKKRGVLVADDSGVDTFLT